jgi:hypothetical protein
MLSSPQKTVFVVCSRLWTIWTSVILVGFGTTKEMNSLGEKMVWACGSNACIHVLLSWRCEETHVNHEANAIFGFWIA